MHILKCIFILSVFFYTPSVWAQDSDGIPAMQELSFVLNTLFLLLCAVLVMFMSAGFAMLEAGMVRSKSVAVILTKNIALYAVAGVMFWLVGYNLMYQNVDGGFYGIPDIWVPDDSVVLAGNASAGHSSVAGWFFQMVFVATAASVVSGALAERIKIWSFFLFALILTGLLYPIVGSWVWGGGWLSKIGFFDFAGSTLVHSVGGWAALTGAVVLGARRGRFHDGKSCPIPGASLPQATLGTFILWLGWFGFNGGSHLAFSTIADALAVSTIIANTNAAAAGGVISVMLLLQLLYKKMDLTLVLNGALAGLVTITAEPVMPSMGQAFLFGGLGGIVMVVAAKVLEYFSIDDVVGAIPVHLCCGILGTLLVPIANDQAVWWVQLLGVLVIGIFMIVTSVMVWLLLKYSLGIRLHWTKEEQGADLSEIGLRAYNLDFGRNNNI